MITFLARLYTTLVTRSSWPWTLLSSAGAMTPAKSISLLSLPLGEARARVSLCLLSRALQGRILYDQFVYYYFIFWGKVFFFKTFQMLFYGKYTYTHIIYGHSLKIKKISCLNLFSPIIFNLDGLIFDSEKIHSTLALSKIKGRKSRKRLN